MSSNYKPPRRDYTNRRKRHYRGTLPNKLMWGAFPPPQEAPQDPLFVVTEEHRPVGINRQVNQPANQPVTLQDSPSYLVKDGKGGVWVHWTSEGAYHTSTLLRFIASMCFLAAYIGGCEYMLSLIHI